MNRVWKLSTSSAGYLLSAYAYFEYIRLKFFKYGLVAYVHTYIEMLTRICCYLGIKNRRLNVRQSYLKYLKFYMLSLFKQKHLNILQKKLND